MGTKRKLEEVEIALRELWDLLEKDGEWTKSHEVARYSRRISQWRNEK